MPEVQPEVEQRFSVTRSTYVQVGMVATLLAAAYVPYQWLDTRFAKLERDMAAAAVRMDDAMRRIESASNDRWTRTNQRLFTLELQIRNPRMVIPEVHAFEASK